jgi:hypothetical protein
MLMHSPSTPTTISVRFLFLMPLMLHTPVAWMRPLVDPTGLDSEAKVKGAPISLSDDIVAVNKMKTAAGAVLVLVLVGPATFERKVKVGRGSTVADRFAAFGRRHSGMGVGHFSSHSFSRSRRVACASSMSPVASAKCGHRITPHASHSHSHSHSATRSAPVRLLFQAPVINSSVRTLQETMSP